MATRGVTADRVKDATPIRQTLTLARRQCLVLDVTRALLARVSRRKSNASRLRATMTERFDATDDAYQEQVARYVAL